MVEPAGPQYRYDHFTLRRLLADLRLPDDAPRPRERFPPFDVPVTTGGRLRLQDIISKRQPLLLVTASSTCPMAAAAHVMLKRLFKRYGHRVRFLTLYVREAHPGDRLEQTSSAAQKLRQARKLQVRDEIPWTVGADDPDGTLHCLIGGRPNQAYLIDGDGRVAFRALCAGDQASLGRALAQVAAGKPVSPSESRRRLGPLLDGIGLLRHATREGGSSAERDAWRAIPPAAALAWLTDLYRPVPPRWRLPALAATGLVLAALTASARARAAGPRVSAPTS